MTRKTTLSHRLPNALTDTRTTHAAYTHVVVGRWSQRDLDLAREAVERYPDHKYAQQRLAEVERGWCVLQWSNSELNAANSLSKWSRHGFTDLRVEAINHGVRQ